MALANCTTIAGADGRELKEHGSAFFPIAGYYDDLRLEAVPWHWHEELEAAVVTEGMAELLVEKEKYFVKEREGFFVNTGVLHAVNVSSSAGCRMHSLVFHPRLVGGSMESVFWQNYIQPLISKNSFQSLLLNEMFPWHIQACDFIETAWHAVENEEAGYEIQVRNALSDLVFLLTRYQPTVQKEPSERELRDAQRIRTMLQYIQNHYMEEIDMAKIAGSAMISISECLRCFHKTIGMTPIRYVKQFRIQKAVELLLSTEKKVGNIGVECGFLDTSYFTKVFRELKGCTPGEYRSRKNGSLKQ